MTPSDSPLRSAPTFYVCPDCDGDGWFAWNSGKGDNEPEQRACERCIGSGRLAADPAPSSEGETVEAHPDEPHEFRTVCQRCGENGYLHVAVITDLEVVKVEDRAALRPASPRAEPRTDWSNVVVDEGDEAP